MNRDDGPVFTPYARYLTEKAAYVERMCRGDLTSFPFHLAIHELKRALMLVGGRAEHGKITLKCYDGQFWAEIAHEHRDVNDRRINATA